ncbi:TonB-linked outer membrane protein, SusC/RagA family [Pedobacter sp. ok626]|uniref:SusC/RagA family TonB-linked outer membrane protein n=1 Tax=Pedobacter sp. ok626 TaxID=1761882 RepID=UPI00087E9190|nr:SusC/RagA family TonB-linked outer membrane protein [Pedobacter sp. ok626]SDL10161.1 TonB-linked outer membrane protein, SusC/RagA family [Pedobacter sp. ok626]
MRLVLFLLVTGLLQIGNTGFSQTITFTGKNVTVEKAFSIIQEQTGYRVAGKKELLKQGKLLTVKADKMPLNDFLNLVSTGQPFVCQVDETNIIISVRVRAPNTEGLGQPIKMVPSDLMQQPIKGKVTDENGAPVSGATVSAKDDKQQVVMTNELGEFMINVPLGKTVTLNHLAFQSKEFMVAKRMYDGPFNVVLTERDNDLNEVKINKGYYSTSKVLNTGSVVRVSAKEIERQPVTNVLQALQSRVPGLIINQQSGNPGGNFNIQIRGRNSINKSNPLFVVDGVPFSMDAMGQVAGVVSVVGSSVNVSGSGSAAGSQGLSPLNSINPEDIESVEVLKDADATAIYGSLGANGVILITTKRGKPGPLRVSANFNAGFSSPSSMPEYMDTKTYLKYRRQLFENDESSPGVTDYDLNGTWDTTRYTRWGKELIGRQNVNVNSRISISGGSDKTQFQIGAGYTTISPPYDGDFSNDRTSLSFSISNTSANNKFKMVFSGNYGNEVNTLPGLDISQFVNLAPNGPVLRNPDGTLNWWSPSAVNPYASLLQKYRATTKNIQGNGTISYQLLPSLMLRSNLGYSDRQFNESRLNPTTSFNPATNTNASALIGVNSGSNWIIEPQAEFNKTLFGGKISLLAGATFQDRFSTGQTTSATGFPSDVLLNNIASANRFVINNRYAKYRYSAVFARANYSLNDRYIINLTGRRDGSSRFAPGRQFGNFGAIGAAWIFSRENWVSEHLPFLSMGKFRGSYGTTGNDQIGDYRYLESYSPVNGITYLGVSGLLPSRLFNAVYGWESNRKFELATELGFFSDRIFLTAAYYRNRSSNQLVDIPLAPTTGNSVIQANLPALIQNKGFEFDISTKQISTKNFSWSTTFNISFERNKLLEFPNLELSSYSETYVIGSPLSISPKLFKMMGVNPITGIYEFMDKDGKAATSPDLAVRTERVDMNPDYYGGMGNSFTYKAFQLDVQLQFVKQIGRNPVFSTALGGALPFTNLVNAPGYYNGNIWMKENDIATLQRLSAGGFSQAGAAVSTANFMLQNSDAVYSDASYIRCKNVSLSWQVDQRLIRTLHIGQLRVYAQAQNLFTITNYVGFDPESQGSVLPPLRTLAFGLQFTL